MKFEELVKDYGLSFCEEFYDQFMDWCEDRGYVNEDFDSDEED